MATPNDRENRTSNASVVNDPYFGAQRKDVTVDGKTYKGAIDIGSAKPPAATEVGMVSPISGLTITGTERNMNNERQAMDIGYTKEYIASRGGINSQGYFNDTPLSGQLTAEEYKRVTLPNGTINTSAMAKILQEKQIAELVAKGYSVEEATKQVSSQYGQYGVPMPAVTGGNTGAGSGGYNAQGVPTPNGQYNAQGQFVGTGSIGTTAGTPEEISKRKSAYDLLYQEFNAYGLGSLVEPLKGLIMEGVPASEFTIKLRETEPYKKRFAANAQRVARGLRALSEAEYIQKEDAYQNLMRNYGMPESYYKKGDLGVQAGFEKLIAGDVSSAELEDRLQTAYNRVINANPEVSQALKSFYPDITNGDILAYALDPDQGLTNIKRKVTAAEIGGAAAMAGLATGAARAEELARYGVTGEAARQGYQTIADIAPRGGQLSEFYKQGPYTQTTAEQEVFGLSGATEAAKQRKRLTQMEQASFSGSSGAAGGALARERAGQF